MPERERFTIPEPGRLNRRYLRHVLRHILRPGFRRDKSHVATASRSHDAAASLFFGPAEELVHDPALPAKLIAFQQSVKQVCRNGLPGRAVERVVFVANAWQRVGGVISVGQLADDLSELGIDVKIVALSPNGFAANLVRCTQPIFFASREDFVHHFPKADIVVGTLWSTMYHVMHLFLNRPDFLPAYFVQDYEPLFYEASSPMREHVERTYAMTPFSFAKTEWVCEQVRESGGQIDRVPPAIDLERFVPSEPKSDPPVLLAMIRPSTPRRNAAGTIRVLNEVARACPAASIEVFGCSNDELSALGPIESIVNHGIVDNDRLPALYSRAAVYLDGSEFHGFGRTIAEALACGTPCVVTRSGGVEDFCVDGRNALLVDAGAESELAQSCVRLLNDHGLRSRLSGHARVSVQGFDRMVSARATLDLFRRFSSESESYLLA